MKIIYGQELVNELRTYADKVKKRLWIAVPYIGGINSIRRIIGCNWIDNRKLSIRLLTDINEFNNFSSVTIKIFFQNGTIKHLAGLHAKIYIIDNLCLLTSANLTNTAFTKRHEVGIFLDEENSMNAISLFTTWWDKAEDVSLISVKKIEKRYSESSEDVSGSTLKSLWVLPADSEPSNYWLKPIGETNEPILPSRKFSKATEYLHFSTKRPTGVKENDILIVYGVGAKQILSIYQSISVPERVTPEDIEEKPRLERWPWYVIGKNLTPNFGNNWAKHKLYASTLVKKYLKKNHDGFITSVGGKNLNALMYSIDKIKLDPGFAKFIIKNVTDSDA